MFHFNELKEDEDLSALHEKHPQEKKLMYTGEDFFVLLGIHGVP